MSICVVKTGTLEYLTADNIAVPHCFTTRLGGVSKGYLSSMNLGYHRGDDPENVEKNYEILAKAIGFSTQRMVLSNQIHSDIVRTVGAEDARGLDHRAYPECDALITNTPGVALVVFTADCTPILLYDPVTGAVGAVHAGWRGTAAGIAGKAVEKMQKEFGCHPENIRAAIGPNIARCCFETDAEVPAAMEKLLADAAKDCIESRGNKFYVNLKEINARVLRRAGVEQIEVSDACTMCRPDRFWSHRVTGGNRGSQGAVIVCKEADG